MATHPISFNRTTIPDTSHEDLHAFVRVSIYISEREIFRTKVVEESETHAFPALLTRFELIAQK